MFPDAIENCTPSIAVVVLQYPAPNGVWAYGGLPSSIPDPLNIKCFTNVVEEGLNKNNSARSDGLFCFFINIQQEACLCFVSHDTCDGRRSTLSVVVNLSSTK